VDTSLCLWIAEASRLGQAGMRTVTHFSTGLWSTGAQKLTSPFDESLHRLMHRTLALQARGWRDRSMLSCWPWVLRSPQPACRRCRQCCRRAPVLGFGTERPVQIRPPRQINGICGPVLRASRSVGMRCSRNGRAGLDQAHGIPPCRRRFAVGYAKRALVIGREQRVVRIGLKPVARTCPLRQTPDLCATKVRRYERASLPAVPLGQRRR